MDPLRARHHCKGGSLQAVEEHWRPPYEQVQGEPPSPKDRAGANKEGGLDQADLQHNSSVRIAPKPS